MARWSPTKGACGHAGVPSEAAALGWRASSRTEDPRASISVSARRWWGPAAGEKMFQRRTSGSVVCPSCGSLVGVRDDRCYTCGRANPGLWGFAPVLRQLGADLGFVPLVLGASATLYLLTLLLSGNQLQAVGGGLNFLVPSQRALFLFGMSGAV